MIDIEQTAVTTTMGHEPGLYISEDGRLECDQHRPYAGSDTDLAGRYIRIDAGLDAIAPSESRCEVCGKTRREAEEVQA